MKRFISIVMLVVLATTWLAPEIAYSREHFNPASFAVTGSDGASSIPTASSNTSPVERRISNDGEVQGFWGWIKDKIADLLAFVIAEIIDELLETYCELYPINCYGFWH